MNSTPLATCRCATSSTAFLYLSLLLAPALSARTVLSPADIAWLQQSQFGLDSSTLARYQQLGRRRFLREQLGQAEPPLPPPIQALIDSYPALTTPLPNLLEQARRSQQQIQQLPDGDARIAAKKALQAQADNMLQQAQQAESLRAVYGPNPLREQMVWFWLNHFSVYAGKGRVRWMVADYEEHSIRPHVLGKFKDLLMASLRSPAMLESLDNAQNAVGKINENYARELMELHTLGVDAGYTQQDVQQLALILSGVGIAPALDRPLKLKPQWQTLYQRDGMFEFNPARHDFSDKQFLGHTIKGSGYAEVEQAIGLIIQQPACARFISRQLAEYFVADQPAPALVERMARVFRRSDGDISQVLMTLFESKELAVHAGEKFKDPARFVVSAMRLAYDGRPIANAKPLVNWLNQLGEPLFGRVTPDGWPLDGSAWASSGQLAKRFEIARAIGFGNSQLFTAEGQPKQRPGFPLLTSPLYYTAIEPRLRPATRVALDQAQSPQEWNTFLLASPDFNYR